MTLDVPRSMNALVLQRSRAIALGLGAMGIVAASAATPAFAQEPPVTPPPPEVSASSTSIYDKIDTPPAQPKNPASFTYKVEDKSLGRIPYRDGDPVPQGYRVESKSRMGLVIGGIVTGAALWTISTITAISLDSQESVDGDPNFGDKYWPMLIPVVGPFIAIKTADSSGTGAAILGLDGVVQTGALAMIIAGLAFPKLELVPQKAITIGPIAGSGGAGIRVGGMF